MVDVNSTVCYLRTDIWTWGKDTIILLPPQWGSNSKVVPSFVITMDDKFQSPQWGSNPKVPYIPRNEVGGLVRFSPRNGEVILKWLYGREK